MVSKFEELTNEIESRVEKLDYVLAFWIHGSYATERAREDSDINYAFLIKERADYDRLKRAFSDVIRWRDVPGPYPEQQWEVAVWKKQQWTFKDIGWSVVTLDDLKDFEGLFSEKHIPYKGERWVKPWHETHLLRYQGDARTLFEDSKIKYDPEEMVTALVQKLKEYPEPVKRGVKNWALGKLRKRLPWHGKPWIMHDKFKFIDEIQEDLHYIAIAHYALNGRYPKNDLNHYEADLKTLKPDIEKLMQSLIAYEENDKHQILVDIIGELDRENTFE